MQVLTHYSLVRLLGRGGFADVYLARQHDLDRYVAIKVLDEQRAGDPDARAMFVDEARIGARLCHANLPFVYDIAAAGDTYYLAMEYVDGVDLREVLATTGRVPYEAAIAIAMAAAAGLDHAHREVGVVHRDVSPTNIMISRDGDVKVIDFGIAIAQCAKGKLAGKTRYMSPEQALGEELDARSDVFSLGVVLYELATGQRCFDGDSDEENMLAIVHEAFLPPCLADPDLPPALGRVIETALAGDRAQRYASATELADALAEVARACGWTCARSCIAELVAASDRARAAKGEAGGTLDELTLHIASDRADCMRTGGRRNFRDRTCSGRASFSGRTERRFLRRPAWHH